MGLFDVGGAPCAKRVLFDEQVGVDLLENKEGVGDADGAFEEPSGGLDLRWRMLGYKARERSFELPSRICETINTELGVSLSFLLYLFSTTARRS